MLGFLKRVLSIFRGGAASGVSEKDGAGVAGSVPAPGERDREAKAVWKELYREYFGMDVDTDPVHIPTQKAPEAYDLVMVFPIGAVELFRDLSKKIGLHDFHTHTLRYNRRPELSMWDDDSAIHVRNAKSGPYAVWLPKFERYGKDEDLTAVGATFHELLLQIAATWKSGRGVPPWRHAILCAGTEDGGYPSVTMTPNRFNAHLTVKTQRVYVVGPGVITLPGFPARVVTKIE